MTGMWMTVTGMRMTVTRMADVTKMFHFLHDSPYVRSRVAVVLTVNPCCTPGWSN